MITIIIIVIIIINVIRVDIAMLLVNSVKIKIR